MKLPDELQFIAHSRMKQRTTAARLDGKVCVLTGATSGVGYHTAHRLAQGGAHLVLVCRNIQKAEAVRQELTNRYGNSTDLVIADFSRLQDVRGAAAEILAKYLHLDILINNAGVHMTHRRLTADGYETAFAVNHLAPFLFTQLLLERMISSTPARILQVNSQGHRFGGLDLSDLNWDTRRYNGYLGYGASKIAQLLTVLKFEERLKGSGVTINAVHPGEVKTNIGMNNEKIFQVYQKLFIWWMLKDPAISGDAIYYLAADPEMAAVRGKFFNLTIEEKPTPQALDFGNAARIWELSEQMTGIG